MENTTMPSPQGYSIRHYGAMITNEPRMSVYAEALARAVTPGCTVIDIGAGFGVFAILACKYGAGHVIAIEPDPSVELIMPMAQANGCADKITVVRGISTKFTPDEKADVIISDLRGTIPLFQKHIETIVDARQRLLKPGGWQLPKRDTIRIALARSPKYYDVCQKPWLSNDFDIDLSLARSFVVNESNRISLDRRATVSEPQTLTTLDYATVTEPNLDSTVELTATRGTAVHGMQMWFDAEILDGLRYSNAPGEPSLVYGRMFLPFEEAVRMKTGDRVKVRVRARLADLQYILSWNSKFIDGQTGEVKRTFNQSDFHSRIHARNSLAPIASDHVPEPMPAMQMDADCLHLVGDGRSIDDIAAELKARHPEQFGSSEEAIERVRRVLSRYGTTTD